VKAGVFLDRDGVIIEDSPNYVTRREDIRLLPGAAAAIRALNENDIPVVVVTNQSAVARGMITEAELQCLNQRVAELLAQTGDARWDRIYYCPYHPDGVIPEYTMESDLRKPQSGMLLRASRELGLDLPSSFMIGDKSSDILAGERAGCHTILVLTGPDSGSWQRWSDCRPDFIARDLGEAVRWILSQVRARYPGRRQQ